MPSPLVSIITVTLNPGEALLRTIKSIKSQTCRDFEHIVKDAGSRDGSVTRYAAADGEYRPTVLVQTDKGIYEAMNQGLQYATGKYVLFLNAGDCFCDPEVLKAVAQAVAEAPEAALLYGDYVADAIGRRVRSPAKLYPFTLYRNTLCHQTCLLARDRILVAGGFDVSMRMLADYDLLVRVVIVGGGGSHYLNRPLVRYQGGGVSANPANLVSLQREMSMVRRRHFPFGQRLLYGSLRALTLPGLRNRLMRAQGLAPLQRAYVRLANLWNT
jgi:glycosyltransferase involved in cell wall biosynthesis